MTDKKSEFAGASAYYHPIDKPGGGGLQTFRKSIGIQVNYAESGTAQLSLEVDDFHLQSLGSVHGGVYATLIDSAIAHAVRTGRVDSQAGMTTELTVSFLKRVTRGSLRAVAKVEHLGQRIMIGSCDVFDDTGKRVAMGKATFYVATTGGV
ncbi:PaaI family thioesterase [Marinobacter vinifirmus]|uniref:PaaI family thioesterase n=1 Tax=Marinobacter vinifirmus TaxID=355591 RepID=A0A558B3K9_9GAMM|nr:PaaI family thioesterase [Marinobacter vinifirmus]TVT31097.1 MAG: PaaI family thioesterase [Marinobacter vinifirmus]